jgi:hypothetical protein
VQLPSIPTHNSTLTEDAIKKAFIPYLKAFYKNRYAFQPDSLQSSTDNVAGKGLVADGMLRFSKSNGEPFVCTFEATSLDKSGEVKYRLNTVYFIWDCLAFSTLSTAVVYAWMYYARLAWLASLHITGNIGMILGLATFGFFTWYYLLKSWRKYRYIYAIEQFKRYFADEQWIALGDDVFPAPHDPYLQELKHQCIYNGFGLALVSANGTIRALASPSRLGIYGKDRKMVHFITRNEWYKSVAQNMAAANKMRPDLPSPLRTTWNKISRPVKHYGLIPLKKFFWKFMKEPLDSSSSAYERYMQGRSVQQWVFGLGITATLLLGYQVLQYQTENYIDESTLFRERGPNPEDQPGYIIDGDPLPYSGEGIPKQYPSNTQQQPEDEEIQIINLSGDE